MKQINIIEDLQRGINLEELAKENNKPVKKEGKDDGERGTREENK